MKKFVALLLGSAMLVSGVAGLVACKPDVVTPEHTEHVDVDPKDGKCDVCGKDMSSGTQDHDTHPDADFDGKCDIGEESLRPNDPVPSITLREDPRAADAYTVHGPDGETVGSYRALSDAIEAAVENDLDRFEDTQAVTGMKGSYVTLKGSDEKIFRNQRGFSATRGDVYYYYENGALTGVEAVDSTVGHALNKEWVNYRISQGIEATQPQNGYKLLDGKGEIIQNPSFSAASREWEFYAFSDASIRATPTRDKGATGSRYTVDLSNVKIAPPYKGVENKTYAFLGFVVQARQYVFELGIACDTSTGNWYTYCSHSPGQKSQVFNNYDIGELVMSSSWNAEGGYFTPANKSVEFEIMEKRGVNDFDEAVFWNEMTIKTGEKTLPFHIDADFISAVSAGSAFDVTNGFIFVAGLDIVEKDSEVGDDLAIADYTNGSYFKDLAITKSEIYFPTDEEVEGGDYQGEVDDERKGKWFSTYTEFGGLKTNVYDYTIVNSAAFVDYNVTAEKSTWSFSYEYTPVTESFAGEVKNYMQKIGSLKAITSQNVGEYKEVIAELTAAYANGNVDDSALEAFTYFALDWESYLEALEVYNKALADTMGPEAKKIVDDLGKLPTLGFFKGYSAPEPLPEGAAATDYLYNAVMVVFKEISDRYQALPEDQQEAFGYSAASYIYQEWDELYTELNEALTGEFGTSKYTVANLQMNASEELTGAQIIESLFECAFNVGYTSNGEKVHVLYGGGSGEYEARASFRILFFRELLFEKEISLGYLDKVIELLCEKVDANAYDGMALIEDFEEYLYPVMGQIVRILKGECTWLDQELADVVNEHMVNHLTFKDPCLRFNMLSGNGNIDGGNFALYFGETGIELLGSGFRKILGETIYEFIRRDSPATQFEMNGNYQYIASEVTALSDDPYNVLSADCKEVIETLKGFANIADLSTLSSDGEAVLTGLATYEALETKYKSLQSKEQEAVARYAFDPAEMFEAYKALAEELNALDNAAQIEVKALTADGAVTENVQLTKKGIVEEFIRTALTADSEKGLLCLGDKPHAVTTFRAYYLYKLIKTQNITSAFVDKVIAYFEADTTEVGRRYQDLAYFFAVGGQIARIKTKAVRYLDAEMAQVVNTYMANHAGAYGSGQGTWCEELNWWYTSGGTTGAGTCGRFNDACTFDWAHYIADGLYGGSYETWGALMNYIGKILDRDAPGSTVMLGANAGVYSLMTKQTVTALSADPTASLPQNVQQLIEDLEALADITDLSKVASGDAVLSGLEAYSTIKATYDALDDGSKTTVALMAYDPTELFAAYKALADEIAALDNTNGITVKALKEDNTPADATQMTAQAILKEFIRCALNKCATGYFCLSHNDNDVGHHVPLTMRAYYLYLLMQEEEIESEFVGKIVAVIKADSYGATAWDAVSTIWPVLGQVARIMKNEVAYLDVPMANALNAALENRTSASFDVGDWNGWWYGSQGDFNGASRFAWTTYIDSALWTGEWTPIPQLMEQLGNIVDAYGNGVTLEKVGNNYGFKLSGHLVGLEKDPMSEVAPDVQTLIGSLQALADITDLSKVASGDAVLSGLETYATLKTAYDGYDTIKKAQVQAAVPNAEALLAAYKALDDQLKALDTTKLSVKALNEGTTAAELIPAAAKEMTKAEIVKEFIKLSLTKCVKCSKYFCVQCVPGADDAFRAYYLYTLIKSENVSLISSVATYSKTSSERRWDDIEMLFAVLNQVARIMKNEINYLDTEMADMINNYLVDRTGAWVESGTAFYYPDAWCWEYRTNGDINGECRFAWTTYIDDILYKDGWTAIPAFMEKLAAIIERDGAGVTLLKAKNAGNDTAYYGFKVSGSVTAVEGPQE